MNRKLLMKKVAAGAGECLLRHFRTGVAVRKKGALDLVTAADEAAEKIVIEGIRNHFPDDHILAEESGSHSGSTEYQWIVDPLDGTTNFTHGFPHFSVSIGLAKAGEVVAGIVFDPVKDEWFEAHLGEGATLNGRPIAVSGETNMGEALGVTGFSYDRRDRKNELLDRVSDFLQHARGLRRLGSAALDLCYIASGRFDFYVEDGLNPWDIAAGSLIVTEAGGRLAGIGGAPFDLYEGKVIACTPGLLRETTERMR